MQAYTFVLWTLRDVFLMSMHNICFGGHTTYVLVEWRSKINEPAHDNTYNKTYVTSKDSDQPVHPPSMSRLLIYPSLDSLKPVEGTCDQQRLWSDCADA